MRILGIETSCDETAAAVVENGTKILSNVVASSVELHKKTGGIIPEVAAREQVRCIMPVIEEAIKQSNNITINNIDAIAVTVGPGLIGSLLVGVETGKTLAYVWKKPIIPVNHLQAHLYANWLTNSPKLVPLSGTSDQPIPTSRREIPQFPAIGLVVSGGHTDLVLMKEHGKLKWLGGTRDDAAGECFDKTARLLGLGYPGGPAIEKAAQKGNPKAFDLPRPMIKQKNFDFSFSGLKTAVFRLARSGIAPRVPSDDPGSSSVADLAASIQQAIVDVLVEKTIRATKKYEVKSILLAGGVAANKLLRKQFQLAISNQQLTMKFYVPPLDLCTDNAAFIASCAYFNYQPLDWQKIEANPSLRIEEMIK